MSSSYGGLARYYDLNYTWKDYKGEVKVLERLISRHKRSPGNSLLELACGTGEHAKLLAARFDVLATDLNPGMLKVARGKAKNVKFALADMADFNLQRQFDVVLCLFSSIGYLKTYARLKQAIDNIARHLVPGGVVIIEPWFTRKQVAGGAPHTVVTGNENVKLARASVLRVQGMLSVIDMHYLIAERGKKVRHYVAHHELAMYEPRKILKYMSDAGLKSRFLKKGLMQNRGLYVGVKS
jgi:ubiquinone/menaquinone biosynthesis C-methylase UbiE